MVLRVPDYGHYRRSGVFGSKRRRCGGDVMDEITFPVTVTMEQMLRHNAAMDELVRLRAQVEALTTTLRKIESTSMETFTLELAARALNAGWPQPERRGVPVEAIRRLTLGNADYAGWDEDQDDVVQWLKTQAAP